LLGEIPIDIETREAGDRGMPIVLENRNHPISQVFIKIAHEVRKRVEDD
jgi:MinD-like ATPase involved in chromosome partitioning or flagellar assembly